MVSPSLQALYHFRIRLEKEASTRGIGVGEMIKKVTDYLGVEQCPRCQKWQKIFDKIRIIGFDNIEWNKL